MSTVKFPRKYRKSSVSSVANPKMLQDYANMVIHQQCRKHTESKKTDFTSVLSDSASIFTDIKCKKKGRSQVNYQSIQHRNHRRRRKKKKKQQWKQKEEHERLRSYVAQNHSYSESLSRHWCLHLNARRTEQGKGKERARAQTSSGNGSTRSSRNTWETCRLKRYHPMAHFIYLETISI